MDNITTRDVFTGKYFQEISDLSIPFQIDTDEKSIMIHLAEGVIDKIPDQIDTLRLLGHLYTDTGDYAGGLETDLKLAKLLPEDPLVWYNLSCSHALLLSVDESLNALQNAINFGYDDLEHLAQDEDLDAIRETEEFERILSSLLSKKHH